MGLTLRSILRSEADEEGKWRRKEAWAGIGAGLMGETGARRGEREGGTEGGGLGVRGGWGLDQKGAGRGGGGGGPAP